MPMNRVQFQPGMSMPEFFERYGSEAQCVAALAVQRWPNGFRCPRCLGADRYIVGYGVRKLHQCRACRPQTSLTSGTLMDSTKLPLRTWSPTAPPPRRCANAISVGWLMSISIQVSR